MVNFTLYENRGARTQQALSNLTASRAREAEAEQQRKDQEEQAKRYVAQMYLQNPELAARFMQQNPSMSGGMSVPPPPPPSELATLKSQEEVAKLRQNIADMYGVSAPRTVPTNTSGAPAYDAMFTAQGAGQDLTAPSPFDVAAMRDRATRLQTGANMPKELLDMNITQAYQGDRGALQANQIQNKQVLDANQQREGKQFQQEYSGVKLPEAQSKIGLQGAQTKEALASVPLKQAQAREANSKAAASPPANSKDSQAGDIADAIIRGEQPPDLSRLYGMGGMVRAKLAQKGYNITKATQDWTATQRYLSTLNGPQQVRLRQAVDFTSESLTVVDDLSSQWQGGRFPLLNKVTLGAAKQGVLGKDAQALANKLDGQIADIQSELATVYKGGNSSTDESLKLASKMLQSNWSQDTLKKAIDLIRQNLTIRRNSLSVGAMGNAGNQYAPSTTTRPPSQNGAAGDPLGLFGGKP